MLPKLCRYTYLNAHVPLPRSAWCTPHTRALNPNCDTTQGQRRPRGRLCTQPPTRPGEGDLRLLLQQRRRRRGGRLAPGNEGPTLRDGFQPSPPRRRRHHRDHALSAGPRSFSFVFWRGRGGGLGQVFGADAGGGGFWRPFQPARGE